MAVAGVRFPSTLQGSATAVATSCLAVLAFCLFLSTPGRQGAQGQKEAQGWWQWICFATWLNEGL